MPIEGERNLGPSMVPVFKDGKRTTVHPDRVKPYDLEAAQALANQVRNSLYTGGYQARDLLVDQINHLGEFARAADEVIEACRNKVADLEQNSAKLHGEAAAANYDQAIAKMNAIIERHVRVRGRLRETLHRARQALKQWRDKPQQATREANRTDAASVSQ